jgi:hypothetical protein
MRWLGWCCLLGLLGYGGNLALAHHGGLGIEGDLVEWALKVDQWQAEGIDQGHRIKFLSYPRQPVLNQNTRLVFEIQSAATGRYVSGLTAHLDLRAPDGTPRRAALPETTGVTAYYETTLAFDQKGEYAITFVSTAAGVPFGSTFHKIVSGSALFGDWSTFVGHLMVFLAFTVTWIGLVLSIQQRFNPPRPQA